MDKKIEISLSSKTIKTIILIAIAIFFIWKLSAILILLITAIMVAAALEPIVKWLNKKLPKVLSAVIVIIGLVLPLIYVVGSVIPDFISQFPDILNRVTNTLSNVSFLPPFLRQLDFSQYFQNSSSYIFESTKAIGNFFFQAVTFIFLVFYLMINGHELHHLVSFLIPSADRKQVEKISEELGLISGHYIRGNLLISVICSTTIFIGLILLNVPYALPLAIFAGVFDLLPLVGSTIGAAPAVILGFTESPLIGFSTIVLFLLYQATENYILAPNIYNKVLNLLPFLSFIAVIIGSTLFGVAGAFLALPIAAGIPTIIRYAEKNKK
jgi:predicted PurR-regulated permease PerM